MRQSGVLYESFSLVKKRSFNYFVLSPKNPSHIIDSSTNTQLLFTSIHSILPIQGVTAENSVLLEIGGIDTYVTLCVTSYQEPS